MAMVSSEGDFESEQEKDRRYSGVKHMMELGVQRLPGKYVLPATERPSANPVVKGRYLPVIDISGLGGARHAEVVAAVCRACQETGFFQVVNHGVPASMISDMLRVASEFFELPLTDRKKYMADEMMTPVRYGTSFNQLKDQVFCWRDFLKCYCHPLDEMIRLWPSDPPDYRRVASAYSEEMRTMAARIMGAAVESLGLPPKYVDKTCKEGSQVLVTNCYPVCPEPELTLGMPPHTDYGCMTILLQDLVGGLQVLHDGRWESVQPITNSFIINVGDHLEVLSNGKYKSVLHRVVVNSEKPRISVATLLSMAFEEKIGPAPELIDEENPTRYRETSFAEFMHLVNTKEFKPRALLESLKPN